MMKQFCQPADDCCFGADGICVYCDRKIGRDWKGDAKSDVDEEIEKVDREIEEEEIAKTNKRTKGPRPL